MARILVVVMVVAAIAGVVFGFVHEMSTVSRVSDAGAARALDDRSVSVGGRSVTCTQLVPGGCDFGVQLAFGRWGGQLDVFLASDLGPWGRGLPPGEAAKLGLQACDTSSTPGQTFLEFLHVAQVDRPEATSPQLFPFWDQARRVLCPAGTAGP